MDRAPTSHDRAGAAHATDSAAEASSHNNDRPDDTAFLVGCTEHLISEATDHETEKEECTRSTSPDLDSLPPPVAEVTTTTTTTTTTDSPPILSSPLRRTADDMPLDVLQKIVSRNHQEDAQVTTGDTAGDSRVDRHPTTAAGPANTASTEKFSLPSSTVITSQGGVIVTAIPVKGHLLSSHNKTTGPHLEEEVPPTQHDNHPRRQEAPGAYAVEPSLRVGIPLTPEEQEEEHRREVRALGNRVGNDSSVTAAVTSPTEHGEVEQNGRYQPPRSPEEHVIVTAFHVNDTQVEEEVRQRILREAVEATQVLPDETGMSAPTEQSLVSGTHPAKTKASESGRKTRRWQCVAALLALVIAVFVVVLFVTKKDGSTAPTSTIPIPEKNQEMDDSTNLSETSSSIAMSTMELVRKRGHILCGVSGDIPGFSYVYEESGVMEGMNIDHCRAISVAVFGSPYNYRPIPTHPRDRFPYLANGTVDVLAITTTHTLGRDILEKTTEMGYTFSVPFFYSGLIFGGLPEYVACADRLDTITGICRALKVCVIEGTTHEDILEDILEGGDIVRVSSMERMLHAFINQTCHVLASEPPNISLVPVRATGYKGPFIHGNSSFSKEPLSLVTREDDAKWSQLVNLIVDVLYLAEAHNISHNNADEMYSLISVDASGNDPGLAASMEAVIAELGNYGDVYRRNVQQVIPRSGLNVLYNGREEDTSRSGLLYSFPFSGSGKRGPEPLPGSALDSIRRRGYIRCAILLAETDRSVNSPEAKYHPKDSFDHAKSEFDKTFCKGIAAALFEGNTSAVGIIERTYRGEEMSYLFENESVDVIAGAPVTILAKYEGRMFSPIYYYDVNLGLGHALMTDGKDTQFADILYWIVMATIYAEEKGLNSDTAGEMSISNLVGETLKQGFRDCIYAVGPYGTIYNQTMLAVLSRADGNMLNSGPSFGPQQYAINYS